MEHNAPVAQMQSNGTSHAAEKVHKDDLIGKAVTKLEQMINNLGELHNELEDTVSGLESQAAGQSEQYLDLHERVQKLEEQAEMAQDQLGSQAGVRSSNSGTAQLKALEQQLQVHQAAISELTNRLERSEVKKSSSASTTSLSTHDLAQTLIQRLAGGDKLQLTDSAKLQQLLTRKGGKSRIQDPVDLRDGNTSFEDDNPRPRKHRQRGRGCGRGPPAFTAQGDGFNTQERTLGTLPVFPMPTSSLGAMLENTVSQSTGQTSGGGEDMVNRSTPDLARITFNALRAGEGGPDGRNGRARVLSKVPTATASVNGPSIENEAANSRRSEDVAPTIPPERRSSRTRQPTRYDGMITWKEANKQVSRYK